MRILFLSHRIPWPLKDGGAVAMHNNLKGLIDAGHEVKLLCLNPRKDAVDTESLPPVFEKADLEFIPINTDIHPKEAIKNLFRRESYNAIRFYSAEFESKVLHHLRQGEFDIVHMEGAFVAQYVFSIKKSFSLPCVLREHNVEYQIWERMARNEKGPLKKRYMKLLAHRLKRFEEEVWKEVDLISAITAEDAKVFIQKVGKDKVFVGGVGFDLDDYLSEESELNLHQFYHLGSMDWLPNQEAIEWLIQKVWPKLEQLDPEAELFLAGKKMPKRLIQRSEGRLHIEGEVPSAAEFSRDKGIMLVPLFSGSGIRIKSIEAMALGKVVISTRLGLKGLNAVGGKHVVEADTPEEFIQAIEELQNNPEKAASIAGAARIFAQEHFSNIRVIERMSMRYAKLSEG